VKKFIAWITSMRLAIGLIAYLAVACVLATLVPQGLSDDGYREMYPKIVAQLVIQTGFGGFFGSILFIIPAFLFFANLSACTVKRLVREVRKKGGRRHGPDILHLGLMALVVGGVWSYSGHQQGSVTLAPGDSVNLPDGAVLHLDDFRFERYPDGRPKDWVSVVSLVKDGETVKEGFELRVNSPMRYGELTFYQVSYEEVPSLALVGPSGAEIILAQGEERVIGDTAYFFMAPDADGRRAVMRVGAGADGKTTKVGPGDTAGSLRVAGLRAQLASGIEAVSDPGYPLVLVALALVAIGTTWTFAQKLKEGV
jgi:cytochrome c biogenesis protein